jgi:hypothetical protein
MGVIEWVRRMERIWNRHSRRCGSDRVMESMYLVRRRMWMGIIEYAWKINRWWISHSRSHGCGWSMEPRHRMLRRLERLLHRCEWRWTPCLLHSPLRHELGVIWQRKGWSIWGRDGIGCGHEVRRPVVRTWRLAPTRRWNRVVVLVRSTGQRCRTNNGGVFLNRWDWKGYWVDGRGLGNFFHLSCFCRLEDHMILGIKYGLGGVGVLCGFQNIVAEDMVEIKCPNTVLRLSFPEMKEQHFDIDPHSARVLKFKPLGKTSRIEKVLGSFANSGPWSPG